MTSPGTTQSEIWTVDTGQATSIVVKWQKLGPEFSYCIWYAKNPEGPWIKDNRIRLIDDLLNSAYPVVSNAEDDAYTSLSYNRYIINRLDIQTKYSVKITCYDRYDSWWYSYTEAGSITGGTGMPHTRPDSDNGNILGFQFNVTIPGP